MSATLSNQAQLRYVLQWFQEWSEMQRGDFLHILIEKCGPAEGGGGVLVNGLVSSLENLACKEDLNNKPPSLFECRVKLFREWSNNWTPQEKDTLLSSIINIDSKFAEKYQQRLNNHKDNHNDDHEHDQDYDDEDRDKKDDREKNDDKEVKNQEDEVNLQNIQNKDNDLQHLDNDDEKKDNQEEFFARNDNK